MEQRFTHFCLSFIFRFSSCSVCSFQETLQTSKSQLSRSPNVADTSLVSAPMSPPPLGAAEVNTIRIIGQYLKNLGLQYVVKHINYVIKFSVDSFKLLSLFKDGFRLLPDSFY